MIIPTGFSIQDAYQYSNEINKAAEAKIAFPIKKDESYSNIQIKFDNTKAILETKESYDGFLLALKFRPKRRDAAFLLKQITRTGIWGINTPEELIAYALSLFHQWGTPRDDYGMQAKIIMQLFKERGFELLQTKLPAIFDGKSKILPFEKREG